MLPRRLTVAGLRTLPAQLALVLLFAVACGSSANTARSATALPAAATAAGTGVQPAASPVAATVASAATSAVPAGSPAAANLGAATAATVAAAPTGACPLATSADAGVVAGVDPAAAPTVEKTDNGVVCSFMSPPPADLVADPNVAQVRSLAISVGFSDPQAAYQRLVDGRRSSGAELFDPQTITPAANTLGPNATWWIKRTPGNPNAKTKSYGVVFRALNKQAKERVVSVIAITDLQASDEQGEFGTLTALAKKIASCCLP